MWSRFGDLVRTGPRLVVGRHIINNERKIFPATVRADDQEVVRLLLLRWGGRQFQSATMADRASRLEPESLGFVEQVLKQRLRCPGQAQSDRRVRRRAIR